MEPGRAAARRLSGMLTSREIELVQSDWTKVEAMGTVAATLI